MDEKAKGFTTLKNLMMDDPQWKEEQAKSIADAHALLDASFKENRDWVVMSLDAESNLNIVAMAREAPRKKMGLILFGGPPLTEKIRAERGKVQ